jgi:hypothetical protein
MSFVDVVKTDYDNNQVMSREEFEIERSARAKKAKPVFYTMLLIMCVCCFAIGFSIGFLV